MHKLNISDEFKRLRGSLSIFMLPVLIGLGPSVHGQKCFDEITARAPALDFVRDGLEISATVPPEFDESWLRSNLRRRPLAVTQRADAWDYQIFVSDAETDQPRWRLDLSLQLGRPRSRLNSVRPFDVATDRSDWLRYVDFAPLNFRHHRFLASPEVVGQILADGIPLKEVNRALRNPADFAPRPTGPDLRRVGWSEAQGFVEVLYRRSENELPRVLGATKVGAEVARRLIIDSAQCADARTYEIRGGPRKGQRFSFAPGVAQALAQKEFSFGDVRQIFDMSAGFAAERPGARRVGGWIPSHWAVHPTNDQRRWLQLAMLKLDDGSWLVLGGHRVGERQHAIFKRLRDHGPRR